MKIKVIDLVTKWANGEEMPKKIKYEGSIFEHDKFKEDYIPNEGGKGLLDLICMFSEFVKDIEIIEENRKIKKIKSNGDEFYSDYIDTWISKSKTDAYCEFLGNKINELIDKIDKLKEND